MAYPKVADNFWYEFDNAFLWQITKDMDSAVESAGDLDELYDEHRSKGTYPTGYITELKKNTRRVNSIAFIQREQLKIIISHFGDDLYAQQEAFEDFGQGLLYDTRPPRSKPRRIHMMDESVYGFRLWHVFVRTGVLLKLFGEREDSRFLEIDRHIGLASEIHIKQHPRQSNDLGEDPKNPRIDQSVLSEFRDKWLRRSFEQIEKAFDGNEYVSKRADYINRRTSL